MEELRKILKKWYPTFNTHKEPKWDEGFTCPCKDCYDVRISGAEKEIKALMVKSLPSEEDITLALVERWRKAEGEVEDCFDLAGLGFSVLAESAHKLITDRITGGKGYGTRRIIF